MQRDDRRAAHYWIGHQGFATGGNVPFPVEASVSCPPLTDNAPSEPS